MATNPILDQRVMRALQETLDDVMLKDTQEFLYSVCTLRFVKFVLGFPIMLAMALARALLCWI